MKCLIWNIEWASATSKRMRLIQQKTEAFKPDIICYTEVIRTVIKNGNTIEANADYGYSNTGEKRKVILWSEKPWVGIDNIGDPELPSGRFVTGITGGIRFIGVCIPWRDAHVRTGRKNRKPWQDHIYYCRGLKRVLEKYSKNPEPLCLLGDFNQRIPRVSQPQNVFETFLDTLPNNVTIVTAGMKDLDKKDLIDHLGVSSSIKAQVIEIVPRVAEDGTRLSDHVAVVANLSKRQ